VTFQPSLLRMPHKIIAHIDMDAFFAAIEQRDNPSLQGKPVVVGADPKGGRGRGVVSTCSYEARKFGIRSAMPISTAYRLCSHAVFLSGNGRKYGEVSDQIFDILYDFTPDIEPVSIDEAFMDLTGSYHFFKTPFNTGAAIKQRIKDELKLTASIGIAPNKMVAKIASDASKPDGLLEILPENMLSFLWELPVERLWGVGPQSKKHFSDIGIKTVYDLAHFSVDILKENFGIHGAHLYELANGRDAREVNSSIEEAKSVSHEHTFEEDTSDRQDIEKIISLLSQKVSRRLRKLNLKGKSLSVKIRTTHFQTFTRAHMLSERVNFFEVINEESKNLFNKFYKPGMKIRLIGIRLSHFEDAFVQDSLFEDPVAKKREKVHEAIDVIKNKFGERSIIRGDSV